MMLVFRVALLILTVASGQEIGVTRTEAVEFFAQYQKLGRDSDSKEADLYCENGTIHMFREDLAGNVKVLKGSAALFKKLIRESAAEAKQSGDYSEYSNVSYHDVEGNVRIDTTRYSVLRKYKSPEVLIIGKCETGELGILEMTVHSKEGPK